MAGLLSHLGDLCDALAEGQHRPNAKWIKDIAFGALASRSLKLSEIGRALDEDDAEGNPRRLIHTHKRLSRGLNSDRLDDAELLKAHLTRAGRSLRVDDGEGCVIALDGSVLVKARSRVGARGQEGACYTWDNARGEVTIGYPMAVISGVDAEGKRRPLLLHPFSKDAEDYTDQPTEHLAALKSVLPYVGSKAIVVADRGYAGRKTFAGLDELGMRWVIREKVGAPRKLMTRAGDVVDLRELAYQTLPTMRTQREEGRGRKRRTHVYDISRRKVKVLGKDGQPQGPWRTLICVWGEHDQPLVLITSDWRRSKAEVMAAIKVWRKRWSVERCLQIWKSKRWGLDLNGLRALTLRGVRRLCVIACALLAFVEALGGIADVVRRCLRGFASFDHAGEPENLAMRMIRGVAGVLFRVRQGVHATWRWRE